MDKAKQVSPELVIRMAHLANIGIDEDASEEVNSITDKLANILHLFEKMEECDTSSITLADQQVYLVGELREDQQETLALKDHLSEHFASFDASDDFFHVPTVIED